ncbi:UNVERIFIED_CONTAM: hypothetical protein K2H54_047090 [Gekko kuhli]
MSGEEEEPVPTMTTEEILVTTGSATRGTGFPQLGKFWHDPDPYDLSRYSEVTKTWTTPARSKMMTRELLDATYDRDLKKLAFFTLQMITFLWDWDHLFLTDEHHVDYIEGKLCKQAADCDIWAPNNIEDL